MSPGRTPRLVSQELRAATALSKTGSARSPAASTACQCPPAGTALWPPAGTALWPPAASTMSRRAAQRNKARRSGIGGRFRVFAGEARRAPARTSQCRRTMALLRRQRPIARHAAPCRRREDRDGRATRRKKLHTLPRRRPAIEPRGSRGIPSAGAGMGLARRGDPHRAHLPLQEFRRGVLLYRTRRRTGRGGRPSPGHLLRLGLCDGLAAHEEDQRAARKRFYHGGEARPHRCRGARLIPAPLIIPRRRIAASPE